MKNAREAFDAELEAIEEGGYQDEFVLALDVTETYFLKGPGRREETIQRLRNE